MLFSPSRVRRHDIRRRVQSGQSQVGERHLDLVEEARHEKGVPELVTSFQPPYSLIKREVEGEQLPWCGANNVGVIVYSPMASGLLTGAMSAERMAKLPAVDWRSKSPEFQPPKLAQNLALAERLRKVAERHGRTAGQAAIAWTLRLPAVTGAIVGARNAGQVQGVMSAGDWRLTPEEITEVEGD